MPATTVEFERCMLVRRLELLDSPREAAYDALVQLASDLTGFPCAALTLCDGHRQWFKASVGLAERETPIEASLCALTISQAGPLILEDLDAIEGFQNHPARRGPHRVQTYVGVPIRCGREREGGTAVASLALFSSELRPVEPGHVQQLSRIAVAIGQMFNDRLRRFDDTESANGQSRLMRIAARLAHCGGWSIDLAPEKVWWSDELFAILEVPKGEEPSVSEALSWYPDDWRPLITDAMHRAATDGTPFDLEMEIFTRSGRRIPVRAAGEAERDAEGRVTRVVGVFMDISQQHAAAEALRLSRERVELALAGSAAAIWDWDIQTNAAFISDRYFEMMGYRRGEISRTVEEYFELVHPDDQANVWTAIRAHLEQGVPFRAEYRMHHRTLGYRWFSVEGTAVRDQQHRALRMAGSIVDVTDQRAARTAVLESEERFRLLSRATSDAIWDWDLRSDEGWWNDGFARLFGYTGLEGPQGFKSWAEFIHPDDAPRVLASIQAAIAGHSEAWEDEFRFRCADGTYRSVLDRGHVIRDAEGVAIRMVGGMTDITDRVAAREQLLKQAEFIDQASDAILEVDLDGRVLFWNRGAERVYGYTAAEALGREKSELLQADRDAMLKSLEGVVRDRHWFGEREHVTRAGERVSVLARWSVLTAADGSPRSVLIIDTDVTERRKIEQQFLRSQRMESIGTLAGGIAHDLNNALSPILLSIQLLKQEERDHSQLELLSTIEQSAKRGADMVRQVLSFARGVEGRRVDLAVRLVIDDVAKIARDTFPKDIDIQLSLPRDLWTVSADPTQLHQVLLNLCLNARDAMPSGGPLRIEAKNVTLDTNYARIAQDAKPGPHVVIEVEDRGQGMSSDVLNQVFDPFFTTKKLGGGTGLGLSTSLAIVRSHGGFIRAYSEPDKGSRFRVYLPGKPVVSPADLVRAERMMPRGRGELILVVDDEPSVREVTKATLESFGYRVRVAADGADAVAQFATLADEVALVLTDMMMPIMDGTTLIQILRRMRPSLRVVAVSGLASDGRIHHLANLGVPHFLAKPYTAETLLTTVRSALDPSGDNGNVVVHEAP